MMAPHMDRKTQLLLGIALPLLIPPLLYGMLWISHITLWPLLTHNILLGLKIALIALALAALSGIGMLTWRAVHGWQKRTPRQIIRDAVLMGGCLTLAIAAIGMFPPAGKHFIQEESMRGNPLLLLWTLPQSNVTEVTLWDCDPVGIFCVQLMDAKDIPLEPGGPPVQIREDPEQDEHYQVLVNGVVIYTAYP